MRLRVKICGITTPEDARAAAELGADAVGIIFAPESPRRVGPSAAARIAAALPPFVSRVGVLVNESPERGAELAARVGLDLLQLHGEEEPGRWVDSPVAWYKAHRVGPGFTVQELERYDCPFHLLDAWQPDRRGGTGSAVDRSVAGLLARRRPIVLSGGLSPENVVEAVQAVRPMGIDVNSGVEASPGVKDHDRLRELFARLQAAGCLG